LLRETAGVPARQGGEEVADRGAPRVDHAAASRLEAGDDPARHRRRVAEGRAGEHPLDPRRQARLPLHSGVNRSGQHLHHPHAGPLHLHRQRLGREGEGGLGRRVGAEAGPGADLAHRGDVDDRAVAALAHRRRQRLDQHQGAPVVDLERLPRLLAVADGGDPAPDPAAGVVDQHVDLVESGQGSAGELRGGARIREVGFDHRRRRLPGGGDLLCQRFQPRPASSRYRQPRALCRQLLCQLATDPA
jgi:hypothetical protein